MLASWDRTGNFTNAPDGGAYWQALMRNGGHPMMSGVPTTAQPAQAPAQPAATGKPTYSLPSAINQPRSILPVMQRPEAAAQPPATTVPPPQMNAGGGMMQIPPGLFGAGGAQNWLPPMQPPQPPTQGAGPGTQGGGVPGMPNLAQLQAPALSGATSPYISAVQQSLQPYFDQQQQQLKAQLAAQGLLGSGAGSQGLQQLTADQNAQISGAVAPLIQQGFGQQFQAAGTNAGAYNNALMQMIQNQLQAQQFNAQMGMQGQEFNANLLNNAIMQNTGYANNALMQGAGYGQQDYLNALAQMGGFMGTNLSALGYLLGQGTSGGLNAYLTGQQTGAQYANQNAQNQAYQNAYKNQQGIYDVNQAAGAAGNWYLNNAPPPSNPTPQPLDSWAPPSDPNSILGPPG